MNAAWLRPRWLFSRRAAKALLWRWWSSPRPWAPTSRHLPRRQRCRLGAVAGCQRGLLPGVAAVPVRRDGYGWWWMRRRLLAREEDAQARRRLVRSEIAGVVAIVALEASLLMQAS
jgi:hypothetical protein